MRLLSIGAALALALGLGGCAGVGHDMEGAHHEGMMGGMMAQHDNANCPGADTADTDRTEARASDQAQHEQQAPECPRANEAEQQHQHDQQAQPN